MPGTTDNPHIVRIATDGCRRCNRQNKDVIRVGLHPGYSEITTPASTRMNKILRTQYVRDAGGSQHLYKPLPAKNPGHESRKLKNPAEQEATKKELIQRLYKQVSAQKSVNKLYNGLYKLRDIKIYPDDATATGKTLYEQALDSLFKAGRQQANDRQDADNTYQKYPYRPSTPNRLYETEYDRYLLDHNIYPMYENPSAIPGHFSTPGAKYHALNEKQARHRQLLIEARRQPAQKGQPPQSPGPVQVTTQDPDKYTIYELQKYVIQYQTIIRQHQTTIAYLTGRISELDEKNQLYQSYVRQLNRKLLSVSCPDIPDTASACAQSVVRSPSVSLLMKQRKMLSDQTSEIETLRTKLRTALQDNAALRSQQREQKLLHESVKTEQMRTANVERQLHDSLAVVVEFKGKYDALQDTLKAVHGQLSTVLSRWHVEEAFTDLLETAMEKVLTDQNAVIDDLLENFDGDAPFDHEGVRELEEYQRLVEREIAEVRAGGSASLEEEAPQEQGE